jgi:hypothetical protein
MSLESTQPPEEPHPDEPRVDDDGQEQPDAPAEDIEDPAEGGDEAPKG